MRLLQSRFAVLGLSALSGALLVLAFAPFFYWPLAFFSPAMLMLLWVKAPSRWGFSIGYCFGLGFFGFGVSWVYHSIHEFGQAPFAFAALLTLLFVLIMALYPALLGWLLYRIDPGNRHLLPRLLVMIPAGWVLLEWLRGWLFTGFPWLQLGYSQLLPESSTPLAAIAPVAGVLGVSYAVMLTSGVVVALLLARARLFPVLIAMVLVTVLIAAGGQRWSEPRGEPISVALVQGNIAQENKWDPDWLIPTVDRYLSLTDQHKNADLILWPEVALPGTYSLFRKFVLEPQRRELEKTGAALLTGVLYEDDNGRLYNSLIKLGDPTEFYLKRHLVPFGEVIPFREWMPWLNKLVLVAVENLHPGSEPVLLHAAGQVIGSSICYEDAFGEEMADFLPQATMLVNVSNDAWFGPTIAPEQHLQIAQMRALELARPLLRATNTGITAIVAPDGTLTARAPAFTTTVLTAEVAGANGYTPFARWRNSPLIAAVLFLLVVAAIVSRRADGHSFQEKS